jgi:hypothetical protein
MTGHTLCPTDFAEDIVHGFSQSNARTFDALNELKNGGGMTFDTFEYFVILKTEMIFPFWGLYPGARVANLENVFWSEYKSFSEEE